MATLMAYMKIREGKEAEYEDQQAWLYEQTHANEERVRRYEFFRGQDRGEYYAILSFDDHWVKWIDPLGRASKLAPTNPQAPQEGATALMIENSKSMEIVVPQWWKALR